MRKSFSMLEILFSIVIISILISIAISKIFPISKDAYIVKTKSLISNIRIGIYNYQNLIDANNSYPTVLDNATFGQKDLKLFDIILDYPLIATDSIDMKKASFEKIDTNKYKLYINNSSIDFIYNNQNGTFDCDYNNILCLKINQ
jgi:type II secretory pathway pseudopilin PulG